MGKKNVRFNFIKDKDSRKLKGDEAMDSLWKYLKMRNIDKSLMGCSAFSATTEGEICYPDEDTPSGVLGGHAYSIIDVIEIMVDQD